MSEQPEPSPEKREEKILHISPDLPDLASGLLEAPDQPQIKRSRSLETIIHQLLIVGVVTSSVLMLLGLGASAVQGQPIPHTLPAFGDVFPQALDLQPAGLLALGLLVLIATPILRVIGSVFGFLYERDWRYAFVTFVVFLIVMVSIFLGKG